MKFSIAAAAVLGSTFALAQSTITSKPFKLMLTNTASNYSGYILEACHEGAAIEGLCPAFNNASTSANYSTYIFQYQNYTTDSKQPPTGNLIFEEPYIGANNTQGHDPEPFGLYLDPVTNVGLGIFGLGTAQSVGFDDKDFMYIESYLNDTTASVNSNYVNATYYYRWYVCNANFEGYVYPSLNWVYGSYPPENPTCVWTMVQRVFK